MPKHDDTQLEQVVGSGDFLTEFAELENLCRRIYNETRKDGNNIKASLRTILEEFKINGIIDAKLHELSTKVLENRNLIAHGDVIGNEGADLANQSLFNLRRLKAEILENYVFNISKNVLLKYSLNKENRDNFDFIAEGENITLAVDVKYRKKGLPNTSDIIDAFRNFENFKTVSSNNVKYILFFFITQEHSYSKLNSSVKRILKKDFPMLKGNAEIIYIPLNDEKSFTTIITSSLEKYSKEPQKVKSIVASPFIFNENNNTKFVKHITDYFLFEALYSHSINVEITIDEDLLKIRENKISPDLKYLNSLWQSSNITLRDIKLSQEKADATKQYQFQLSITYIYYVMTGLWGDVCLLPKLNGTDMNLTPPRSPIEEIRDSNISVLKNLHSNTSENTKAHIQIASMLAKYYLEKKDYYSVSLYTKMIIDSSNFSLAMNDEIFDTDKESIIGFNLENYPEISNLFLKLCANGKYLHLIRNTEILLMAAEASFYQGESNIALEYINKIRKRNNKALILDTNNQFIETLLAEWKDNLGGEGSYFFALKRNGYATEKLQIENYQLLLPIPQQVLENNYNLRQNPGY